MSFQSLLKMKCSVEVYNTQPVSHTICPFDRSFAHKDSSFFDRLFQSNQHFQAVEFVDQPIPEKL